MANDLLQQLRAEKSAQDTAKKQEVEALDLATQDAEKKRAVATAAAEAGFITFVISSAELVSKCRIPTAAVAQRGLFRILGAPNI